MAYGDIQLKLVGGSKILVKLDELDKLADKMRGIVNDLSFMGLAHIDSEGKGEIGVNVEKE